MDIANKGFSLIDLFYYLVPGGIVLAVILLIFGNENSLIHLPDWYGATVFLFFSYALGHAMQLLGKLLEWTLFPRKYPSAELLNPDDKTFSIELKDRIRVLFTKMFGFYPNRPQEVFVLCQTFVTAKIPNGRSVGFLGLFGMYRAFAAALLVISVILWASWIKDISSMLLAIVATGFLGFLLLRLRYYGKLFAKTVYIEYIVAANTEHE